MFIRIHFVIPTQNKGTAVKLPRNKFTIFKLVVEKISS
jgi:hypothetical protein